MRRQATARRASASVAIAVVGLVAAAAAAGAVMLGPYVGGEDARSSTFETEVPDELTDGSAPAPVPDELAETVERPVVVADRRDELPSGVTCSQGAQWEDEPEVEAVLVTPTELHAAQTGDGTMPHHPEEEQPEPRPLRATCSAVFQGGGWQESGGSFGEQRQGPVGATHGSGASCCSNGHGTAHADVALAGEVAWILQDRGPYWLAYPVDGLEVATVSWPFNQSSFGGGMSAPPSQLRLLDEDYDVVVELEVR